VNLYGFVGNSPCSLVDDLGMSIFGGTWGMFLHYFGVRPDDGQLSVDILQAIESSRHMRVFKRHASALLLDRLKCCSQGRERISAVGDDLSLDDVLPLGLRLWGASSGGKWQWKLVAKCSWSTGAPDGGGICEYDAECRMRVTVYKLYTFRYYEGGNPRNAQLWVRLLHWAAWLNNWGNNTEFHVTGDVYDNWEFSGRVRN
jgi:hypothetical protein